ncbi:hypothetical protein B0I73DRAFT_132247 [Yarrowia lipolytica]|uniref:YALI0F05412p n=2 Tax=Yarrowia lipolytica TaxID=4952 RepID=Q6C2T1_YARLI|nr:YALI0F05412p [Yarrowia lipolytica CLIB122]AOW06701.1 hypothetical protein YALI1_F08111g [Yarrowia lipolytica]KAB8284807.1 hypothetical protein BKA91DRAFT_134409 [Yarrowia lipolytica]KAE8174778.1 hypothetical protein BKA90DRAFT_133439 [Yarrowia lipolytica]KAJ8056084.1 hypothetical protein LXG23DRAFT_48024 [Yarrowia lipolytica]QNQ00560.1 Hypothetical protein YALI2_F00105g [Yarrowia lipolytica]|eukprot:XP_505031.1 YALI0F05412p [Yarrowia lipolytica CLIB122]
MTSHHLPVPNASNLRLASLVRELSQLSGVDFALVTLSTTPINDDTCSETAVSHSLPLLEGRHFSLFASSEFKGHIGAVVDENLVPALVEHKQAQDLPRTLIDLTNTEALLAYLAACLFLLQQETCKNIARTWIKFIEPKKQSKYPYKRGSCTAPPWWPRGVTHKEPDHLQKNERINLLTHLLLYSDFSLETLMEATNENRDVVPSPKRVFVDQAFDIAQVYRFLHRSSHPNDGSVDMSRYTNYEVIHVHALTYGQNRYERKDEPRMSSRAPYRSFGMSLPTEDNRGMILKRECSSSSPIMLSPGYPGSINCAYNGLYTAYGSHSGSTTPRMTMEPVLPRNESLVSRNEPPRGYFKPHFSPETYRAPPPAQPSNSSASKYHYPGHYGTSYTYTQQPHNPYYVNGYYAQQSVGEIQMRSPPSSSSSANTSVDSNEDFGLSAKRSMAVDDVRPLKRPVSR